MLRRRPRGTRSASGHHSFSNRALYRERCLRGTGRMAQATRSRTVAYYNLLEPR